jgi:hypothetical protein
LDGQRPCEAVHNCGARDWRKNLARCSTRNDADGLLNRNDAERDMNLERIKWEQMKGRQRLLLDKIYDAVTEEFTRDAMASLATVLAHLSIVTDVAKPDALGAFGNVYDETRDKVSGSCVNATLLN